MEIPDDKKIEILLAQLEERYTALHNMRDRSMQFALWILGFGLGMAWLLISEVTLNILQMVTLAIFLAVIGLLSINFVRAIEQGFNNNRNVVVKIETILKLYEKNTYDSEGSILPKEFSEKKFKASGHFATIYSLMVAIFIFLIILTLTNPCKHNVSSDEPPQPNKQIQKQP